MKSIEHSTLIKPIYDSIKSMIVSQELMPGEKIIQEKIASELGVSRTPLLRALQLLENEFLVESIPRRGMYVRQMTVEEMIDVFYCRESIECMAARLAAQRALKKDVLRLQNIFSPFEKVSGELDKVAYAKADEHFHDLIIELSNNKVLQRMAKISNVQLKVYSVGLLRKPEETLLEHKGIVDAIDNGDADGADRAMRNHINQSIEVLKKL